jgi:hypothetical protein
LRETPARPDLSQIAEDAGARKIVAAADEMRGKPAGVTFEETDAAADARLQMDYAGELEQARQGALLSVDQDLPTKIRIRQKLITQQGALALARGDVAAADRTIDMVLEYRDAMSRVGRALAEGRDRFESAAKQNFRMLMEALVTPDPVTEKALADAKAAGDGKKVRAIKNQIRKQMQENIDALLREEGIDVRQLTEEDMRDPILTARIGRFFQARNATLGDKVLEYWMNAVLSAPLTHVVNVGGTGANVVWHYTVQRLAESALNMAVREKKAGTFGDLAAAYKIVGPGMMKAAWAAARLAWATERPQLGGGARMDTQGVAIGGKTGRVVRGFGSRLLLMADEFNKRVAYQLEMVEQGHKQARLEGLEGDALTQRAAKLAENPTEEMISASIKQARVLTFTAPAGPITRAINSVKSVKRVRYPMTFMFPFVKTPAQVLGVGVKKSPLGAARVAWKAAHGEYRGEGRPAMVRDVSEQLVAQALMWIAFGLMTSRDEEGRRRVTGSRNPTRDPGEKAMRQAQEPAMSIRIGNEWYSYARLDPFATALASMIDTAQSVRDAGAGKAYQAVTRQWDTLKGMAKDRTFLQGLSDLMAAVEAGDTSGQRIAQWAGNFAASWVPNVVRSTVRATDGKVRDYSVRGEEGVPGRWTAATLHKALPLPGVGPRQKLDYWGRPVTKGNAPGSDILWRMLVPSNVQDVPSLENIDRLIFNWNRKHEGDREEWWPPMPGLGTEIAGVYREMTPGEYETFLRRRGQIVLDMAGKMRWRWQDPKLADLEQVKRLVEMATATARKEWQAGKMKSAEWTAGLVGDAGKRWE